MQKLCSDMSSGESRQLEDETSRLGGGMLLSFRPQIHSDWFTASFIVSSF